MQDDRGDAHVPITTEAEATAKAEIAALMSSAPFAVNESIEAIFTYHPPTGDEPGRYLRIREAAKTLAYVIDQCCPPSPDRTAAIRSVSEAVMTANASIARRGASYR